MSETSIIKKIPKIFVFLYWKQCWTTGNEIICNHNVISVFLFFKKKNYLKSRYHTILKLPNVHKTEHFNRRKLSGPPLQLVFELKISSINSRILFLTFKDLNVLESRNTSRYQLFKIRSRSFSLYPCLR